MLIDGASGPMGVVLPFGTKRCRPTSCQGQAPVLSYVKQNAFGPSPRPSPRSYALAPSDFQHKLRHRSDGDTNHRQQHTHIPSSKSLLVPSSPYKCSFKQKRRYPKLDTRHKQWHLHAHSFTPLLKCPKTRHPPKAVAQAQTLAQVLAHAPQPPAVSKKHIHHPG